MLGCQVNKLLTNDIKNINKNYVVPISVYKKSKIVFNTLTLRNMVSWFILSFLFCQMSSQTYCPP